MQAVLASNPSGIEPVVMPPFDSDAFIIGIDNHASRCMGNHKKHFFSLKQTKSGTLTKGIAEGLEIKAYSTVHWNIMDDLGQLHYLVIKQVCSQYKTCIIVSSTLNPASKPKFPTSL